MSLRTRQGLGLLASIVLIAAACGSPTIKATPTALSATGTPATGPTATPAPFEGGTLVMGEWQAASQLNPFFSTTSFRTAFRNFEALGPVLRGLYAIDDDGHWVGDLGTEVPTVANGDVVAIPAGGFTLVLKMKPGLRWSDGAAMTMADFKWTYDWALATARVGLGCTGCAAFVPVIDTSLVGDAYYAPENQYVKTIDISADGLTASVVFRRNYSGYVRWAATSPLAPQYWQNVAADQLAKVATPDSSELSKIPWSGPFVIVASSANSIDYARNPYWAGGAAPSLDGLRFRFFDSKDAEIRAFLDGQIDFAFNMTAADYPAIAAVDAAVGRAQLDSVWQYEHLDLNTSHPGLDDLAVRTAIAGAIDKQTLSDVLFPGADVEPACSPAPPGAWWRVETTCPAYDPSAAAAALDAAGWKVDDATGLRTQHGVGLRFKICTNSGNPTRLATAGRIAQYLAAIGIPTDIQTADAASTYFAGWADTTPQTQCSIYRGTYDLALFASVSGADAYGDYYPTYHSRQIPADANPNGSNDTRISDPAMDAALKALGSEIDPDRQKALAATVQQTYAAVIAEIPLYYRTEVTGVGVHVGGWAKFNPTLTGPTWNVETWTFVP